jgi:hypothetical protein
MVHTNEMEKAEVAGTGFTDCFKGTNRRRTEIVSIWHHGVVSSRADAASSALYGLYSTAAEMSLVQLSQVKGDDVLTIQAGTRHPFYNRRVWPKQLLSTSIWP